MDFLKYLPLHTWLFIIVMLVFCIYIHFFKFNIKAATNSPTIFTTFGIFATFIGIAFGLLKFDVNNVQTSVPDLLDGLKTAFWASVFGVGIALTIKVRYAIFGISAGHQEADIHGATIDDLVREIINVRKSLLQVQQALVGNDDSTLLSQVKLTRQDTNDRLDMLKKSQQEFMEKMADNNSKALIQALQEVIRDFNAKINEQFGENFKHLNAAVENILVWQEKYRQQLGEMIEQQKQTAISMTKATSHYTELVNQAGQFKIIAEQLGIQLKALEEQRNQIEQSLKSLGQLLVTASSSLPQVEKKIMELTLQMTSGVKNNQDEIVRTLREASTSLQNAISNFKERMIEQTQLMTNGLKNNQDEMARTLREATINLNKTLDDVKKIIVDTVQKTNQDFNNHIIQLTNKTKEQVATLDIALEKELTKSLDTLARQLTALSQKFVEDYTPLTERLRQVLNISKGV